MKKLDLPTLSKEELQALLEISIRKGEISREKLLARLSTIRHQVNKSAEQVITGNSDKSKP